MPNWSLPSFIGLVLKPFQALLDTGAQHGVVGKEQYEHIVAFLAEQFKLKPRALPTKKGGAHGVGGGSEFLKTVEMPTAIQGNCGTLTVNVLPEPIPLLLPICFSKALPGTLVT